MNRESSEKANAATFLPFRRSIHGYRTPVEAEKAMKPRLMGVGPEIVRDHVANNHHIALRRQRTRALQLGWLDGCQSPGAVVDCCQAEPAERLGEQLNQPPTPMVSPPPARVVIIPPIAGSQPRSTPVA